MSADLGVGQRDSSTQELAHGDIRLLIEVTPGHCEDECVTRACVLHHAVVSDSLRPHGL